MDISQPALMTNEPLRPRRSPFSFLRSVKSLFFSLQPADSPAPPLPHLDRSPTQLPFPKSFFNRVFRKCPPRPPHSLGSDPQRSFFDDDNDLDRRVLSPPRLSVSRLSESERTAHSILRLSSAFAHTSPDLSSPSSVVPTIAEQSDTPRSDSRTDLVSELSQIHFPI